METNIHTATRIKPGYYNYRGVTINKLTTTGFCATVQTMTGWHWAGRSTLKSCIQEIDNLIDEGFVVYKNRLYHLPYYLVLMTRLQNAE
jgi:hypothetical protein